MATFLVTGASGYIGRHVVRSMVDRGLHVISLDRNAELGIPNVEQIVCDFTQLDAATVRSIGHVDGLLHLAWADGFNHQAPSHIDNLPAHARLIRSVLEAGVTHIAALGTMHEVGYWEGQISESTPCQPMSYYGIAKFALREIARLETEKAGGFFQWLRAYYIVGDDQKNNSLFKKILEWEREGRESFPFNSGRNLYDFIDISILAEQITLSVMQNRVGGVIECCSGQPVALRDKVETFLNDNALVIRPEYGAFPDRAYDSPGIWGDPSKIRKVMGREYSDSECS